MTPNVRTIRSIPLRLTRAVPALEARGEIFLSRAAFERAEQRARAGLGAAVRESAQRRRRHRASARRAHHGPARARLPLLRAGPHRGRIAPPPATHDAALALLRELGLRTNPLRRSCADLAGVIEYHEWLQARRDTLAYEIDGIVVKVDELDLRELAGSTSKIPALGGGAEVPRAAGRRRVCGRSWCRSGERAGSRLSPSSSP